MNWENLRCPTCHEHAVEVSGGIFDYDPDIWRTFCNECEEILTWKEYNERERRDTLR